jgi:acyl-CoA hydrolase
VVSTGANQKVKTGKLVTYFAKGSTDLYDFIDDKPGAHFKEAVYTNGTSLIRQNPKISLINLAIKIDLTDQVRSDNIGRFSVFGWGRSNGFLRGVALFEGGKPLIAMLSITKYGISKIAPFFKEGAGITATQAPVYYTATEYGLENIYVKNLKQREEQLISIAHPHHREQLEKDSLYNFAKRF